MGAAFRIAAKDLKLRVRDRSVFIVGLIAPLGLAFIFDLILGPIAEQEFVPAYAVVDEDGGEVSRSLVELFRSISADGIITLESGLQRAAAEQKVQDGELAAAIEIPAGFSNAIQTANPATIQLVGNVESPTSVSIARSIVEGFGAEIQTVQLAVGTVLTASGTQPSSDEIVGLGLAASQQPRPIALGDIEAASRQINLSTFFVAGMGAMFLFFTVQFGVLSLLEERKDGTMSRLMAAPISRYSVIGGKALVSLLLGVVSMAVMIVASTYVMGAEWGEPVGVASLVLALVISALGIMAVVAAFSKTSEQAGNLQSMIGVGLAMIGGIFFPASLGTGVLAKLSYISPHRWFLLGLNDLAGGDGLGVIVQPVLALVAFGIVTGGLALLRLRKGLLG